MTGVRPEHSALTLPMADSTMQGYCSGKLHMMAATSRMRSALATDEPPNFMTTVICRVHTGGGQHGLQHWRAASRPEASSRVHLLLAEPRLLQGSFSNVNAGGRLCYRLSFQAGWAMLRGNIAGSVQGELCLLKRSVGQSFLVLSRQQCSPVGQQIRCSPHALVRMHGPRRLVSTSTRRALRTAGSAHCSLIRLANRAGSVEVPRRKVLS